jgi:DNA modification methylase
MLRAYNNDNNTKLNADELWDHMKSINEDDKVTKLNYYIWQRYASSVWDDVRGGHVLSFKQGTEEEDGKHVTPTQLDVIDRLVDLYSNEGETVFTPFMGIGTEVYGAVSMGRKAIGVELKDSYYNQAIMNLKNVKNRFKKVEQTSLF